VKVKEEDDRKMEALSGSNAIDSSNANIDNEPGNDDDDFNRPQTHFEAEQNLRGYLCPHCDVEGTSHYLIEYFEAYRRSKTHFCKDEEAVDRVAPATELGRKFIEYVISGAASNHLKVDKGLPGGKSKILSPCKLMGMGNGGTIPAPAGIIPGLTKQEVALETISEIQLTHISRVLAGIARNDDESATSGDVPLDPTFLVGQPIKLYSPIEDAYHVGRIVDWKTVPSGKSSKCEEDEPPKKKQRSKGNSNKEKQTLPATATFSAASSGIDKLDYAIGRTQYLVRFRAGIDGRKISVHQWMFLEEHSVAVGVGLVWANPSGRNGDKVAASTEASHNGEKASSLKFKAKPRLHYRPAQVIVRSALEMLPVKKSNSFKGGGDVFALVHYFHRNFHCGVLKFGGSETSVSKKNGGSVDSQESPKMVAADFARPPCDLQKAIREARIDDDASLVLSVSMATMEREEERRVREFHKLPFEG